MNFPTRIMREWIVEMNDIFSLQRGFSEIVMQIGIMKDVEKKKYLSSHLYCGALIDRIIMTYEGTNSVLYQNFRSLYPFVSDNERYGYSDIFLRYSLGGEGGFIYLDKEYISNVFTKFWSEIAAWLESVGKDNIKHDLIKRFVNRYAGNRGFMKTIKDYQVDFIKCPEKREGLKDEMKYQSDVMTSLVADEDVRIRNLYAQSIGSLPEMLSELRRDKEMSVRISVINNEKTPTEIWDKIEEGDSDEVKKVVDGKKRRIEESIAWEERWS